MLSEAFHTGIPAAEFTRLHSTAEWNNDPAPTRQWIADLFEHLPTMRAYPPPSPYWAARRSSPAEVPARDPADAANRFDGLVGLLHARGYLSRDFPEPCPYDDPDEHLGHDVNLELRARLQDTDSSNRKLWPLQPEAWDTDTFYSLVEAFHDLIARSRHRWDHEHDGCGPHFEDFDTEAGRRAYRTLVNRIVNNFAIRHQRRGQEGDYDPAFLDWIIWWYLATIELSNRLLVRQSAEHAP